MILLLRNSVPQIIQNGMFDSGSLKLCSKLKHAFYSVISFHSFPLLASKLSSQQTHLLKVSSVNILTNLYLVQFSVKLKNPISLNLFSFRFNLFVMKDFLPYAIFY